MPTADNEIVPPLGGTGLRPLLVTGEEGEALTARAGLLPRVEISRRAYGDLVMLGIGGFTPLSGFMGRADWFSVCGRMTIASGVFWPMPVLLDVPPDVPAKEGEDVLLTFRGETAGVMRIEEIWEMNDGDLWYECETIYKGQGKDSDDFRRSGPERHPGVRHVLERHRRYLGGTVAVLPRPRRADPHADLMLSPAGLRRLAAERGWTNVACFQLRNPPHRSHEYLIRIGLEVSDAVLIHTPLGELKSGDFSADVRLRAIRALIDNYLPRDRTILAGYPLDMRYAGPREALFHAAFRQNYGIGVQIVGRDHAGVADFYAPFEAQDIFSRIPASRDPVNNLQTRPLRMKWPFYCKKCDSMASLNTCPHEMSDRVFHSGSLLRKCLAESLPLPEGFVRREVFEVLSEHVSENVFFGNIPIYGAADGSSLAAAPTGKG